METIVDFIQLIKVMHSELGQEAIVLEKLAVAFAEGAIKLIRHDQVTHLRILKSRIMQEVESVKRMESATEMGATKGALLGSGIVFALGSLFAAAGGRKDAFNIGAILAQSILTKTVPFGTVHIAIGKGGLPEVVSVSRLARESSRSESEVVAIFRNNGYLSMTPETFTQVLNKVERGILDGSLSLPINIDKLNKQILEGC